MTPHLIGLLGDVSVWSLIAWVKSGPSPLHPARRADEGSGEGIGVRYLVRDLDDPGTIGFQISFNLA